jgi:ribosomal protein S18 acetylase RimI-like enzyme
MKISTGTSMVIISEFLKSIGSEMSKLCIELSEKPWESKLLSRNVIALVWNSPCKRIQNFQKEKIWTHALQNLQLNLDAFKPYLLTARIPSLNREATRALENSGFHLIECYLELEHNLEQIPPITGKNIIRPFRENEIHQLEKIAFESFQYSRFHMDPQIKAVEANTSRSEWVKNSCKGRAEAVFVAEVDQRPVGFVICKEKTSIGILDLIAVYPDYRNRKLGYDLTVEFLKFCRSQQYYLAKVGTQAHNIPSIRMYEKTGFVMSETYYSYHKHLV